MMVNLPVEVKDYEIAKPTFSPGGISVGTWKTQAEFKDIKVESAGKVLFESKDGTELKPSRGAWQVKGGALQQTSGDESTRASVVGENWTNYTLTLKAPQDQRRRRIPHLRGLHQPTKLHLVEHRWLGQ